MPSDLDQLAQDADHQDRWGTPPTGNGLQDVAGQQQMTHQPEQPNPVQPYVDWLRGAARRTFVDPLQATGFLPGGQDWGRPAVEGMMNFNQSGLTGVAPSLRNIMPGAANTLGDLVQSPSARNVFSSANLGGLPLVQSIHPLGGTPRAQQYFDSATGRFTTPENFAKQYFAGYHDPNYIRMDFEPSYSRDQSHIIFNGDLTRNGEKIGEITRTIYPYGGHAEHDWLNIRSDLQGTDIAKQLIRNQFYFYDDAGIQNVGITAVSGGSYSWLKYGWLPNRYSLPRLQQGLQSRFNDPGVNRFLNDSERAVIRSSLASRDPRSMWDISDLSRKFNIVGEKKPWSLGKIMFKGNNWSGDFNVNSIPQRDRLNAYTRPKP